MFCDLLLRSIAKAVNLSHGAPAINQSEASIQVTWSVISTYKQIRGHYWGHVICLDQSENSITCACWRQTSRSSPRTRCWSKRESASCMLCNPIRSQYSGHVIYTDQSEASIFRSRDQYYLIVPPLSKSRIHPPLKKRKTAKQNSTVLPAALM